MAGNAREWCWNEAEGGTRCIFGGAWSEPEYMFSDPNAAEPMDRSSRNGFRCMEPGANSPVAANLDAEHVSGQRRYADEKPVSERR